MNTFGHRMPAAIVIFTGLLGLTACTTVELGRKFDLQRFQVNIQHNLTTRDEIRDWLGEPAGTGVSVDSNGTKYEEWVYYFATGTLPGLRDAQLQILQIKFDARGIVRAYNWSSE